MVGDRSAPPGGRGDGPRGPALRPTRAANLVVAALLTAALAWFIMRRFFGDIPDLTWLPALTLGGLAVVEGIAARNTKARVEKRPRAGQLNPLLVARLAVLAKASSLGGAIFAGAYGGVAAWALSEHATLLAARANLAPALAGLVGGLVLVAAALLLERACRVPDQSDDQDESDEQR
ncbi:MAG TPA: DUF3180 domain-containing protein [Micromonosporaceae bacterium]|nr:DUF3180 domain-containing protein [Micromonosporaceae bacterium]